jgi:hypothetical protein
MKTKADLIAYLKAHPGMTARSVKHNNPWIKLPSGQIRRLMASLNPDTRPDGSLSRRQFASQYDLDTKLRHIIQAGVKTLVNSDEILEDSVFRRERCFNCPTCGWKEVGAEKAFSRYRFQAGGKVHWASPCTKKWALRHVHGARDAGDEI